MNNYNTQLILMLHFCSIFIVSCNRSNTNDEKQGNGKMESKMISYEEAELRQADSVLFDLYSKIELFRREINEEKYSDSIVMANEIFENQLLNATKKISSFTFPFDKLIEKKIEIITSPNLSLRIFSWDKLTGGSMHYFGNIFQFKDVTGIHSTSSKPSEGDPGGFYSNIYSITTDKMVYYLGIRNSIYSLNDMSQSVKIFYINKGEIIEASDMFHTKDGIKSECNVSYKLDKFEKIHKERPIKIIEYDDQKHSIRFPIMNANGDFSGLLKTFYFNGEYFIEK